MPGILCFEGQNLKANALARFLACQFLVGGTKRRFLTSLAMGLLWGNSRADAREHAQSRMLSANTRRNAQIKKAGRWVYAPVCNVFWWGTVSDVALSSLKAFVALCPWWSEQCQDSNAKGACSVSSTF